MVGNFWVCLTCTSVLANTSFNPAAQWKLCYQPFLERATFCIGQSCPVIKPPWAVSLFFFVWNHIFTAAAAVRRNALAHGSKNMFPDIFRVLEEVLDQEVRITCEVIRSSNWSQHLGSNNLVLNQHETFGTCVRTNVFYVVTTNSPSTNFDITFSSCLKDGAHPRLMHLGTLTWTMMFALAQKMSAASAFDQTA